MDRRRFFGTMAAAVLLPGITILRDEEFGAFVPDEPGDHKTTVELVKKGFRYAESDHYGLGFKVSRELLEDDVYGRRMERELLRSAVRSMESMIGDLS